MHSKKIRNKIKNFDLELEKNSISNLFVDENMFSLFLSIMKWSWNVFYIVKNV